MKTIICAVRGQPESRATVTKAINIALEHKAQLIFCLVIDAEFLGHSAPTMAPLRAVYRQLEDMGEFSMLILCDRARNRGIEEVDYIIRKGNIPRQLHLLAAEIGAEMMVLGRPFRSFGRNVFTPAKFEKFVEKLERETGTKIIQVVQQE
jgi:nucleotide-binding universal stress UspA family protein